MRWSKFWWQDYERDPLLRSCSLAAQGLWMRMLCFMHEGNPYGHLILNGVSPSQKRLAAMVGKSEREVNTVLKELEEAGVFSRTEDGVIWSRRLVRDKAASDKGRDYGSGGGNPLLLNGKGTDDNTPSPGKGLSDDVNPYPLGRGLTPPVNAQEAEAKSQSQKASKPARFVSVEAEPVDVSAPEDQPVVKPKRSLMPKRSDP